MSLRAIADVTRISVTVLEAIERSDISRLPGGIFSRGFVRAYATEVGLDVEATVEDFVRQFPHESVTVGHPPSTRLDHLNALEGDRRALSSGVKLAALGVAVAALVVYLWLYGWPLFLSRSAVPQGSVNRPAVPAVVSTVVPAVVSNSLSNDAPITTGSAAPERAPHLRVELVATRPCRLSISVDGQSAGDAVLAPEARRSLEAARELSLTVSDGGAVELTINGSPARPIGQAGVSATLHLTLDNYRAYLDAR